MGLFGQPRERLAYRDPDKPYNLGMEMEKAAERSFIPATARTAINAGLAVGQAQKTGGGVGTFAGEFARREVVLAGRLLERGEPDRFAIEARRKELRKAMEEQGLSDYIIDWKVDLEYPTPAARGETEESRNWREAYFQLLQAGRSPREAWDALGRRPKQFAGQEDKRRATVPSSSGRGALRVPAEELRRMAGTGK